MNGGHFVSGLALTPGTKSMSVDRIGTETHHISERGLFMRINNWYLSFFFFVPMAGYASTPTALIEYEGLYEYENDTTLIIVAGPNQELLYADISGARYPLRPIRPDVFLNAGDIEVEFVRDGEAKVMGYRENKGKSAADSPIYALLDGTKRLPASIWVAKPEGAPLPYRYRAPAQPGVVLKTHNIDDDSPLAQHLSAMVNAIYSGEYPHVQSVLVYRNDALVFEEYFYEFDRDKLHQMRSATKTLIALLAGIAIDRGDIPSTAERVLPYFEEYANLKSTDQRKHAITINDLLTMRSGLDCNDWDDRSPGNESKMIYAEDWARFILDVPMTDEPGNKGSYCSGNVILMGRIIEKTTGMPLKQYVSEVLFGPLGIDGFEWDFHPDQTNSTNFAQAWLRPIDMMKIGVLISNNGRWNGEQLVSAQWIRTLTSPQSEISGTPYGFYYWLRYINTGEGKVQTPQVSGNGGQKIIQLNEGKTVIVMTGGNYNQQSHTNDLLVKFIIPGLTD